MLASILLLSFPILYITLAYYLSHSKTQILCIFCICTITISSIRWESGTDWDYYYSLYLNPSFSFYTEKGYAYLSSTCSNLGISYNLFLAILALPWILLAYLPLSRLKLNYQASYIYLVALYSLSFLNFIGSRQQVTIALIFALMLVRSFFSKALIFLIGIFFHSSFLLFLLILYSVYYLNGALRFAINRIKQLNFLRNTYFYFTIVMLFVLALISVVALIFPLLTNLILAIRPGYVDYFSSGAIYIEDPSSQAIRTALKLSFYILPPLIYNLFDYRNRLKLTIPQDLKVFSFYASPKSWALLTIIGFLFLLTTVNPNIGGRLELYMRPFLAVQVSLFASLYFNSRSKFSWPVLTLIFGLLSKFIFSLFTEDWYLPYTTIFTN